MDALRFLEATDGFEVIVTSAVARAHLDLVQQLDRNRAVMIANEIGRLFRG